MRALVLSVAIVACTGCSRVPSDGQPDHSLADPAHSRRALVHSPPRAVYSLPDDIHTLTDRIHATLGLKGYTPANHS